LTVHLAEIADVHDGDDNGEVFVCFYLPLSVAAQITVQPQQGAIAIAIRSPSARQGNISSYNLIILICHSQPLLSSLLNLLLCPVPNANSNCLSTNADSLSPNADSLSPNADSLSPNAERLCPNTYQFSFVRVFGPADDA
jgi:hypothetical protein